MASVSGPEYSELCGSNLEVYTAYLSAYRDWVALLCKNGQSVDVASSVNWTRCIGEVSRRGIDFGERVGGAECSGYGGWTGGSHFVDVGQVGVVVGGGDGVGGSVGDLTQSGTVRVVGVSCGDSVGGRDSLVGGSGGAVGQASSVGVGQQGSEVKKSSALHQEVSDKTLRNRRRRAEAKERKKARQAGMKRDDWRRTQEQVEKSGLQASLEEKWIAQNKVAVLRANRELELLKSQDLEKEKKKRSDKLAADCALLEGQLSGKYSLVAPRRVTGFAKTVITATSSEESAAKSLWSGKGASSSPEVTSVSKSSAEVELEKELVVVKGEKQALQDELKKVKSTLKALSTEVSEAARLSAGSGKGWQDREAAIRLVRARRIAGCNSNAGNGFDGHF